MADIPIYPSGDVGLVKDTPRALSHPTAWTEAHNVVFRNEVAYSRPGYQRSTIPIEGDPEFALSFWQGKSPYIIYTAGREVYLYTGSEVYQIGGRDVIKGVTSWDGMMLGNIPILTSGFGKPIYWTGKAEKYEDVGSSVEDIPDWPDGVSCLELRSFKNYGIALQVYDRDGYSPQAVMWSHPAAPNSLPETWDYNDLTKLAGRYSLADTPGEIVDGRQLGDYFVVYKTDAVYIMREVGGNFVFSFERVLTNIGLLSKNCVTEAEGSHVFASYYDIKVFDGNQVESVLSKRTRDWLFEDINLDAYEACYMFYYPKREEVWFCYPSGGSENADKALIWNPKENTLATADIPESRNVVRGSDFDPLPEWEKWDTQWDEVEKKWVNQGYAQVAQIPIALSSIDGGELFELDSGELMDDENYCISLERRSLAVVGKDAQGSPRSDVKSQKLVSEVWPDIQIDSGSPVFDIYVGWQDKIDGPVEWDGPFTFNPEEDVKINPLVRGPLICVRVETSSAAAWSFHGYSITIKRLGRY